MYSDEEDEEDDSESEGEQDGNTKEEDAVDAVDKIWNNPHGELLSRKREFYASVKKRIVAHQARDDVSRVNTSENVMAAQLKSSGA